MKEVKIFFFSRALYLVMRALKATYRIERIQEENFDAASGYSQNGVPMLAMWHEYSVPVILGEVGRKYRPLASRSSSGRIAGYVLTKLGYWPAYGSSTRDGKAKGGKEVRSEVVDTMAQGYSPAFTVDGSIGPRRVCKAGVVSIAKKTGNAIIPVASVSSNIWVLKTWDRMQIPKPFAKVLIIYGSPVQVPANAEGDAFTGFCREVGNEINRAEDAGYTALKLPKRALQ